MATLDAVVVGSGPNGLAAAITLARAGLSVHILEAEPTIGGAARSLELTLPGFAHDIGSAIHPFAYASPFFRQLPLEQHGLSWIHSPAALAHPFVDAPPAFLEDSVEETARGLGADGGRYRALFAPASRAWRGLLLQKQFLPVARHAFTVARLGLASLRSAEAFIKNNFRGAKARALMAGSAAHSMLPLDKAATAAVALGLTISGHACGWPFPRGGAQKLSDALASYFQSLGGTVETGFRVTDLNQIPPARAILLDLTPGQVLAIARDQLPARYARLLSHYRYGMAAFKMDWALSDPVPWRSAELRRAATVHIGGTFEEIAASERAAWSGPPAERPFIICAQHTLFDASRAPTGKHTLWAYCHVPHASAVDMADRIERQIERFAPGFRDTILARSALPPSALERRNANLVGGDILGGMQDVWQVFMRPTFRYYSTPLPNVYICSASTPPGAGVHGMCGYFAARVALKKTFRLR